MAYISRLVKKKLGELLIEEGLLKEDQLKEALAHQKQSGQLLGTVLLELGYVSETDIARALSRQFGLPYIDASKYLIKETFKDLVDKKTLHQNVMVILDKIGKTLIIAVGGPIDTDLIAAMEKKSGCHIFIYVSTPNQVEAALKKYYPLDDTKAKISR